MTCVAVAPNVIVCGGGGSYERRILPCWGRCNGDYGNGKSATATVRRRVVVRYGSPYYGPDYMCVTCGDTWCREGIYGRPLARNWREGRTAKNRALWDATPPGRVQFDDELYPIPR